MADVLSTPLRRPAFAGLASPGRLGETEGAAGVTVGERAGLALATLIARRGAAADLSRAVRDTLALDLPASPRSARGDGVVAVWTGPGQWLLVADPDAGAPVSYPGSAHLARLSPAVAGLASLTDQTDARGILRLSGPMARATLAKGVGIDLHPRAFAAGDAAVTRCALMDVTIWQVDDTPAYDIAVARGFAGSFWHWLVESAAEYGVAVIETGPGA